MKRRMLFLVFLSMGILGLLSTMQDQASLPVLSHEAPVLYLTFDDGPSQHTAEILDILDQYQIKATFFVTAANPGSYDEITEAYARGHTIGLHTATHHYEAIYSSVEAYFNDLEVISQIVTERTGQTTHFIRFPGGSSNTISEKYCAGIMHQLVTEAQTQGYLYFDWNGEIGDAIENCTLDSIIATGKAQVDGIHDVMLLCHDGVGNAATVKALPVLIEYYQSLGYQFACIDEHTPGFHHRIYN